MQPNYSPNVVNQTVAFGGRTWRGQPGGSWVDITAENQANDAKNALAKQTADTQALNTAQEAKQNDFLTRFRDTVGAQEKLPDMASRIGGTLGLPQLRDTAQGLVKSVAEIPQVQTNATRGYDVNSNQLSRIISTKQAELAPAAQTAVNQVQTAEGNLSTQLGYGVQQQLKDLTPFTAEQSMMSEQLAREYSGFTQDKQNQLQLIMQNLANGQQITLSQLQAANDLAKAKIQYDSTINDVNKLIQVSPGNSLYNNSGQLIATAPKSLTGTASGW